MTETGNMAYIADNNSHIIDKNGKRLEFNDPRVVHIWPYMTNNYVMPIVEKIYKKKGWRFRSGGITTSETLHLAKSLCSGRECLSFTAITGGILKDIINRNSDEISVYYSLEQEGPCQIGAWPHVLETFARRLNISNVVFPGHLTIRNNFLGQGDLFGTEVLAAVILGDLLHEAEGTLFSIALNRDSAFETFHNETKKLITSAEKGLVGIEFGLKRWANKISKIPLKIPVEEATKVLIFGGGAVSLIYHSLTDYFASQNIIPKVVDFTEFLSHLEGEQISREGFKTGRLTVDEQYKFSPYFLSFFKNPSRFKEIYKAFHSRINMFGSNFLWKRLRKIGMKSGLLYDEFVSYQELNKTGEKFFPCTVFFEGTPVIGRYFHSVKSDIFDGLFHVATFNCQPSIEAQAFIRSISNSNNIPFAGIEMESPDLTPNQLRILETLSVQSKRRRHEKNQLH